MLVSGWGRKGGRKGGKRGSEGRSAGGGAIQPLHQSNTRLHLTNITDHLLTCCPFRLHIRHAPPSLLLTLYP